MIIGKGSIADRFVEYSQNEQILIFASDHSDSNSPFHQTEETLIQNALIEHSKKIFVYFSTASIYDIEEKQTSYVQNKLKIEKLIIENAQNYLIIRVPIIASRSQDDKTLLSYLTHSVLKGDKFELWNLASRNIIDIDDVYFLTDLILREKKIVNQIINIASPFNISVHDLVHKIERFLNKKGLFHIVEKGSNYPIDINHIKPLFFKLGINFSEDYIDRLIQKYFRHLLGVTKSLNVVVPTYFAEKGIVEFHRRMRLVLEQLKPHFNSEIIFVNDGSTDKTQQLLIELSKKDPTLKIINFSRNFGNQYAIAAGLDKADCDLLVIIDDDLQDPPEVILNMIAIWENGFDIVYGVRRKRVSTGVFFQFSAKIYYRLLDYLSDIKIPLDTGDFRLIDKKALVHLKMIREENRYFRGIVAWIGFKQFGLLYDRDARFAGTSNFTLKKYLKFAFDGVTSFSEKPLYISSLLGLVITGISFLFAVWIIYSKIVNPSFTIRGWASVVTIILFFGGLQLLSIGVIGLYIGKIYREVKDRPIYIVESETGFNS